MSERKVLNKYYPPDYDPSKIPKLKLAKDRQYVIRVMAPFHMRCKTCGNYIYKGTKFNSRKETVQDEDYLGLRIFRFYIKCTKCVAEITFKTDPENQDYAIEHGATRNFEAEKLLQEQEKREREQEEEDESNPMKLLEKRTKDSKREMELMENLEELRDLNQRQANINFDSMIGKYHESAEEKRKREAEEDEEQIKEIFGTKKVRRLDKNNSPGKINNKTSNISLTSHIDSSEINLIRNNNKINEKKKSTSLSLSKLGIVKKCKPAAATTKTNLTNADKETTSNTNSIKDTSSKPSGLALVGDYGSSSDDSDAV